MAEGANGQGDGLSIGQVAERTGLSVDTLRFYEREGLLLDAVRRGSDGRRRYRAQDVEWLAACTKFRAAGMSVAAIRRYAELVRQGDGTEGDRLALLVDHRRRVVDQIAELNSCLDLITSKIQRYQDKVTVDRTR